MAYTQFPDVLQIKTLDTSEEYNFANFSTANYYQELANAYIHVYVHGTEGGSEEIRVKIYSDSGLSSVIDTSNWAPLSLREAIGTYDLNTIRIDFNSKMLAPATTYYATVELQNYTRSGDTFYIGIVNYTQEGWMELPGVSLSPVTSGIFQPFGFRKLRST